jgi:hypothetical protein
MGVGVARGLIERGDGRRIVAGDQRAIVGAFAEREQRHRQQRERHPQDYAPKPRGEPQPAERGDEPGDRPAHATTPAPSPSRFHRYQSAASVPA